MENCSICGDDVLGYGHNPAPVAEGRCCDVCNTTVVIPTRINNIFKMVQNGGQEREEKGKDSVQDC
tara:strand:+ start:47 stop:244 length:198 start_codon:yes stop_codon:yes gene_type:complete